MNECLRLAAKGRGRVSPNPMVGAVLVKNGRIVARGYHHRFGGPHAETDCLRHYSGDGRGTTLYVNLEPCSISGKTPPCVDEILRRGIPRVVVGMTDPNPKINGRGISRLRRNGVKVIKGILSDDCRTLNQKFSRSIALRRPFIIVKVASSLDGKIAGRGGRTIQISGKQSQSLVHRWRAENDAVLVGAGTVKHDDPRLTVRFAKGRNSAVVILDGSLHLNARYRVFRSARQRPVFLCTTQRALRHKRKVRSLETLGVHILPFHSRSTRLPLSRVLRELYRQHIGSLLVEGGGDVFGQFARLFDEFRIFLSPKVVGEGVALFGSKTHRAALHRKAVTHMDLQHVGDDVLLSIYS
jgi:diaminohydroxyphosphoribosylaminopyrimidine deaminase/5-amino-6-(5-phosphoribosylamino)uracil reductase